MFKQIKFKKNIFFLSLFFLLKTSPAMVSNHPVGLGKDTFFLIIDCNTEEINKQPLSSIKNINAFHHTIGNEAKLAELLYSIQSLRLVSKTFLMLTDQYIQEKLQKFLTPQDLFHYQINMNKSPCINKNFLIYRDYSKTQMPLFERMQWYIFYEDLIQQLRESAQRQSFEKPTSLYLIKASKNALKYASGIMYYNTLNQLHNNKQQGSIDSKVLEIYHTLNSKNEFDSHSQKNPNGGLLDRYVKSDGKNIPKLLPPDKSLFVPYDKAELKPLEYFIIKHRNFCFGNKNTIFNFLNNPEKLKNCFRHCNKDDRKQYLIMRFLIVFNSIKNEKKKEKIMYKFLPQLSNAYWYNKFNFV
jgi:hypothetical protein